MTDTTSAYADWFQALLDQNRPLIDTVQFERDAYSGYTSYGLGGAEPGAAFRPIPFEKWVLDFRADPINTLYYGNDNRHKLAPHVNSYIKKIRPQCKTNTCTSTDLVADTGYCLEDIKEMIRIQY